MSRLHVRSPFITFVVASAVIASAAAGTALPAAGLLLLLAVAWASARDGLPAGMLSSALAVAALLTASTIQHGTPLTAAGAANEIAYTLSFVAITYLIAPLRQRIEQGRATQGALRMEAVAAEEKLTGVLESVTDGFLTLDADWRLTYVNRRAEQMVGRSREKLLGHNILDVFPEGSGSRIHREMERAQREKAAVEFESYYEPARRWFEVRGYPAADGGMTAYFRDVTRRKRAQEAVLLQARMLDAVRQAVVGVAADGVIFYWNRAAQDLLGWRPEQVVGRTTIAIMQPDLEAEAAERVLERLASGEAWSDEMMLRKRDGALFPALVADSPIRDDNDAVLGTVRVVTDLSDRIVDQLAQRFLANAGSELASTLDFDSLLAAIALLATPGLGDCCIIDVVEEDHASRRIESAWSAAFSGTGERHTSRRSYHAASPAAALLSGEDTALITRMTDGVLRAVAMEPADLDRLRRGGVRSVIVAPLKAGGRLLGTMSIISVQRVYGTTDAQLITEFARRAALAVDNAILYEAARLANQAKSDFLAVMSHELRTPLTTVMGYTDLLLADVSGALTAQSRNYVERVRTAAWHLLGLIEQILIYTRVEVGREQVHVERVPVEFVLRDAAALIEPVAAEKGLSFVLNAPGVAAYVDTDLTKLRQILLNLLSNAVKFTEKGEVVLEAQLQANHVEFVVRDTGIGIAPEHLDRVFESFWQVDQSATRKAGGTGLGLSVARRLARLLNGDVSASSTPGVGTTFVLRLPRAQPRSALPQLDSAPAPG